jgi:hypothetical protein
MYIVVYGTHAQFWRCGVRSTKTLEQNFSKGGNNATQNYRCLSGMWNLYT